MLLEKEAVRLKKPYEKMVRIVQKKINFLKTIENRTGMVVHLIQHYSFVRSTVEGKIAKFSEGNTDVSFVESRLRRILKVNLKLTLL